MAERRLGGADRFVICFPDDPDPSKIRHSRADRFRARIHAIACGYEDADDLDFFRAWRMRRACWTIEPSFRDTKDLRFGMGMSQLRIDEPERRGRTTAGLRAHRYICLDTMSRDGAVR